MTFFLINFTLMNCQSQTICEGEKVMFYSSFNHCNNNEWVLVFEDEFYGNTLDLSTWWLRPWGAGSLYGSNGPTQEYNTLDNTIVENGVIRIFALQDSIVCKAISYLPDDEILSDGLPNLRPYYFTSSNIWSKKEFEFGKIEARIKIPKGKGLKPAFWMYSGDVRWNEIDVFEFWNEHIAGLYSPGLLSKVINMTAHYDYDNDGQTNMCHTAYTGEDFSNDFHIFALEWEPNRIAWYVDGNCLREDYHYYDLLGRPANCNISAYTYYTKNRIFTINPMNIIFNLAIQNGDGQPDSPTIFPANMYVDWIRYYKRGSNSNVSVTDSTLYPLNSSIYNSIVGNTIDINCPYTINQGNQLSAVATSEIVLYPGFYVENGGIFSASINDNSNSKTTDTINKLKKTVIDETVTDIPQIDINIYPTLNQGFVIIETTPNCPFTEVCAVVYDMLGHRILSQSLCGDNEYTVNLSNCPNGAYIIQIINKEGVIIKTTKIVISK